MAAISNTSGVLALVLTIVGLYGVIAYGVSQRLREFAVRMALDARPSDILGGVVSRGRLDGTTVTGSLPGARSKTSN
jgi:putative ABC transport system permease protein